MPSIEEYRRNNSGEQKDLTDVDKMILTCAADANISTAQWDTIFQAAGLEEIKDILELTPGDFDSITFSMNPLLQHRVEEFQDRLEKRSWEPNASPLPSPSTTPPDSMDTFKEWLLSLRKHFGQRS